jgi:DNA-binding MarR family transcriptional regulator
MREEILGRVNSDLLSVPPLISRVIRKKLLRPTLGDTEIELRIPHFEIMRILKDEGTLHPAKIGEKLCIAKAQMTHLIDKLVEINFVKREWGEDDRRTLNITLTSDGNKLLEEQDSLFRNALRDNLASLSDSELETISNSLRILRSSLLKL